MRRSPAAGLALVLALGGCARTPVAISGASTGAYEAALAAGPDGLVAAWYDMRTGNADIYFRELDPDGRPSGSERRLTSESDESYEPSIDAAGEALAVAWYDKDPTGVLTATVGVWERSGAPRWRLRLGPYTRNPVVRAAGTRVFCAWIAGANGADAGGPKEAVWAAWWDAEGRPLVPPRHVGPAGKTTRNVNATLDDSGVAWVVYDAKADTIAEELFVGRVDETGVALVQLSADDGKKSKYPDLAIDGQRAALTWFDERDGSQSSIQSGSISVISSYPEGVQCGSDAQPLLGSHPTDLCLVDTRDIRMVGQEANARIPRRTVPSGRIGVRLTHNLSRPARIPAGYSFTERTVTDAACPFPPGRHGGCLGHATRGAATFAVDRQSNDVHGLRGGFGQAKRSGTAIAHASRSSTGRARLHCQRAAVHAHPGCVSRDGGDLGWTGVGRQNERSEFRRRSL